MSRQITFHPVQEYVTIDPIKHKGHLRYVLLSAEHIKKSEITIKFAFPRTWHSEAPDLRRIARNVLIQVLDIANFDIEYKSDHLEIVVPLKRLSDDSVLQGYNPFEIQLAVKIQRTSDDHSFQIKARQVLIVEILPDDLEWEKSNDFLVEEDFSDDPFFNEVQEQVLETNINSPYSGIISVDFGTTNSVIVVRDPHFAAEEIGKDLSREQWAALSTWVNNWLIEHLSMITPSEANLFIEKLSRQTNNMELPPCGSLSIDIWEELEKTDLATYQEYIHNVIIALVDSDINPQLLQKISYELLHGLEKVIYSKTLQSQRYFILELDANAGAKPIPSTLQIISAPQNTNRINYDTEIEMGVRVSLLMRSATLGDDDIRQFALSIKRYFGRDEHIDLFPSEAASTPTSFNADTLCLLAYRKLLQRAINDIQKRANKNQFSYADTAHTIVATFPTTYPASLRRKLRDLLYELDIHDVDTRFDEGSASLLYYVWHEICADPVCGMEGLMSRCRVDRHNRPYQNILLYDLGGGTTDIALIQLIYEELPIFEPMDKTATSGGSYFRITPRLLGSTGHSFIGGYLITLWLFRLLKTKVADKVLSIIAEKQIDPPPGTRMSSLLADLDARFIENESYRPQSLLEWTYAPQENIKQYEVLNDTIIDIVIPTRYQTERERTSTFFTLWHMTEEAKKNLGTPSSTHPGSSLGHEWPQKIMLDSLQLYNMVIYLHPWLENCNIDPAEFTIEVTQEELCKFAKGPVSDSLHLAMNLAKARLKVENINDKVDRLILSGLSCNLKIVQQETKNIFRQSEGVFNFNIANVFFDQELAKTSVAMGACVGRYLESMRLDPTSEKTRQMLRSGYNQIELVVENLFTHLACRLVYDSLVAMVVMFDYGQELNKRSYIDNKPVARTEMDNLRPVQEKLWIYRVDFDGASPLYLGLVNAEAVAMEHDFSDFRKFREHYLVGFEADAELFVRGFFVPRGPKNIVAQNYIIPQPESSSINEIIAIDDKAVTHLTHDISSQELFKRKAVLEKGQQMIDTIEYPNGEKKKCVISKPLAVREMYDFYIEGKSGENKEPQLIAHFHLPDREVDEVHLCCDETGKVILLYSFKYDIRIWGDIDYVPQKIDSQFDPFCGQH